MAICKNCDGEGAVKFVPQTIKDHPCYWLNSGEPTCAKRDGTGEEDS